METRAFVDSLARERIVEAIRAAELKSQAELRVHISAQPTDDAQKAAIVQFEKLEMTKTRDRNAVLIYVAPKSQNFAVIGDTAIHACCGTAFWEEVAHVMQDDFRAGRFTDGLLKGVERAGDALAKHFPRRHDDTNELSDDVSVD